MNRPYDKAIRTSWLIVIVGLLIVVAAVVLRKFGIVWWMESFELSFLLAFILLALVCLPMFYYMRKKAAAGVHEITEEGKFWLHWTYDPLTWEKYSEAEWKLAKRNATTLPLGGAVVIVVIEFIAGMSTGEVISDWWIPAGIAVLVGLGAYLSGFASYKKNLKAISETYVGPSGILFRGGFMTWKMFGARLGTVKVEPGDPSILEVDIVYAGRGSRTLEVRLPIPPGEEQRAEEVVAKLNALK